MAVPVGRPRSSPLVCGQTWTDEAVAAMGSERALLVAGRLTVLDQALSAA